MASASGQVIPVCVSRRSHAAVAAMLGTIGVLVMIQASLPEIVGSQSQRDQAGGGAPTVTNYARFVKELQGIPLFHWRVFIDEPRDVLESIAEVQYELHPSFNDPLQVRTDPAKQFALERGGCGEFRIPITISIQGWEHRHHQLPTGPPKILASQRSVRDGSVLISAENSTDVSSA